MEFQNQVQALTGLGITNNQAKIYLALVGSKSSTVTQIAKSANIAREVVYRTVPRLQELGLIIKTISSPIEYEATPIDLAIKMLYEQKIKEALETKARADELIGQIKNKVEEKSAKKPQLISLSGKDRLISFTKRQMLSIQKSLDTMIVKTVFPRWWENYRPLFEAFLEKNVRIRVIVACCQEKVYAKEIERLEKNKNFKIKFIPDQIEVGMGIIDNLDALINTLPGNMVKSSFYWSNDPGVIALCNTYFEKYWKNNS